MDEYQLLGLVSGITMILLGLVLLVQIRPSPLGWTFAASYTSSGICYVLWPTRTALYVDHASGVVGLSALLWACAATFAAVLAVTFFRRLGDRELWWVRATPALVVTIIVTYTAALVFVRRTTGPAASHLLYDGYHGNPPSLFAWNLVVGLTIVVVYAMAAREMLVLQGGDWAETTLIGVYGAGVVYGLLIVGQALSSRFGYGSETVIPLLRVMRVSAIALSPVLGFWGVIGADVWVAGQMALRARYLRRQLDELLGLVVLLSDRLVWRHAPEVGNSLAELARLCTRRDRKGHPLSRQVFIALQAARRITWRRGALVTSPWSDATPTDRALADRSIAAEAAHDVAAGSAPVSDIGHVVLLLLPDVALPAGLTDPLPAPMADHIAAAALLAPYFGIPQPIVTLSDNKPPQPMRPAGLPVGLRNDSALRWTRAWYQALAERRAQAEMNLMMCCELIEDYMLQVDAPDDDDLAVHAWALGEARQLSPLQTEIAQRASQILGLFGPYAVRCVFPIRAAVSLRAPRWRIRRPHHPSSETKVTLWCATAAVIQTVLDPARIPVDVALRQGRLDRNGGAIAQIICQAACGVQAGER
jgi:hypothetical protein